MRRGLLWLGLVVAGACALTACSAEPEEGRSEDAFARSDTPEDTVLPYAGDWLDAPRALSGISQFDRLKSTIHDDAKCSTMVSTAAAIVGGKARFLTLLDAVAKERDGKTDDLRTIERVRGGVVAKRLTPRHLHELTEVMVRAYKVGNGAFDDQIAEMLHASGYVSVHVGSARPEVLVDRLSPGEVVPLGTVVEDIPHITLIWRDVRGNVRLYDSDDVGGSHVMPRGSAAYKQRVDDPSSSWDLREKYR
jgi:hypothetical protein